MEFRPCIDIHNGKVKQIVGSSLADEGDRAVENFVAGADAAYYAHLYKEAGLRGAKAFCKAHKDELGDVETVFVGLDTIRDYDYMAIYSRDLTGTVKNDESACALVKEAAKQNGLDMPYKSVFFGATDAAAVTQSGMKAVSIAAMDPAPARYYHTRLDTADNLDIKTIEAVLGVALETAFLFDEKGLSN